MNRVKRAWPGVLAGLGAAVLIVLVGADWASSQDADGGEASSTTESVSSAGTSAGDAESGADAVAWSRIARLRGELGLGNEPLAAAGLSGEQAEAALGALKSWYETNGEQLHAADRAVNGARGDLQRAWRRVHKGEAGGKAQASALIGERESAVTAAEGSRDRLQAAALAAVEGALEAGQRDILATVRANRAGGGFGDYVYAPGLSGEQLKALSSARRQRSAALRKAGDESARVAAANAFETAEAGVLSAGQREAIAAARANVRSRMEAVLAADAKVLPVPEQLRGEWGQATSEPAAAPAGGQ